jgi:hypothetical protein
MIIIMPRHVVEVITVRDVGSGVVVVVAGIVVVGATEVAGAGRTVVTAAEITPLVTAVVTVVSMTVVVSVTVVISVATEVEADSIATRLCSRSTQQRQSADSSTHKHCPLHRLPPS